MSGLHENNFLKNFCNGYQYIGEKSQLILWKVHVHIFFYVKSPFEIFKSDR